MGCTASKLDNEDTVRRCKERRRLIKEAVYARHHLAAAHSDYCRSLRITGSALVTFASGEPLSVSQHAPAVLLRDPSFTAASKSKSPSFIPPPSHQHIPSPSPSPSLHHPPRPPPMSTASSYNQQPPPPPPMRRKKPVKLPHILSDSSFSSSPPPNHDFTYNARANSTYSSTPSQTSSVWNWDNFYPPPSPPSSEHFQKIRGNKNAATPIDDNNSDDDRYTDNDIDDKASSFTSYSNIGDRGDQYRNPFSSDQGKEFDDRASNYSSFSRYSDISYAKNHTKQGPVTVHKKGPNLKRWESEEEEETEREEVQCSEWGDHDHYSSTTSSSDEDEREDLKSRSDFGTRSNFGSMKNEAAAAASAAPPVNANANVNLKFSNKSEKMYSEDDGKSSVSWGDGNNQNANSDRRIVVRHKDLAEIVAAIREYFDKAASAGEQVSEMLETGRAQLDRSFNQLRSKFRLCGPQIKNDCHFLNIFLQFLR